MLQTKINELDDFLKSIQLSKNDVLSHLLEEKGFTLEDLKNLKTSKKSEKEESKSCVEKESVKSSQLSNWKDYPIINPNFGDNDIRSRVQVGWYAFAGGLFSPKKDAFPDCQGVIGIINDDPNAKEGNRVKIVLRHQKILRWCEEYIYTKVTDEDNGRENTRKLLECGKKKGIEFPAIEFALVYIYDGVKAGEAYVPAINELQELSKNFKAIDDALRQIGSSFNDCYWSSSELSNSHAWGVGSGNGSVGSDGKNYSYAVSCFLDY